MTTYTPLRLAGPAQLTTSATAVYTVGTTGSPSATAAVVKQIVFNNTTSSSVNVSAHLLPVSASAGAANQIITNLTVAPNSQIIWSADLALVTGEKLSLLAATGTAVTYVVNGIEIV